MRMSPILTTSTVKSSKPSKTQVFSTSMLLARSIQRSSTNSLPSIPRNPLFLFHSPLSHPYRSLVSTAQSQTTS